MKNSKNRIYKLAMAAAVFACFIPTVHAQNDGASLYKQKCAACHGPDGMGKTPVGQKLGTPDLTSADVQKKSDADLTTITTKGKGKMPAYEGKLSDAQIKDVIAYIRTLAKK